MKLFHQEITEAAESLSIPLKDLSSESATLRPRILKAFDVQRDDMLETDLSPKGKSIHDPQGWQKLMLVHIKGPFYLFFNRHQDTSIFQVANLNQISAILGECTGMTFFAADCNLKSLVGFDDNDVLFLVGDTTKWPF